MAKSSSQALPADLLETCAILRSVAETFPSRSKQRRAIREAASALVFVRTHRRLASAYRQFRSASMRALTASQVATLKRMGVQP